MRLIQIVPVEGVRLYGAMSRKEVQLSQKKRGTFFRSKKKERDKATWSHTTYKGWIKIQRGVGEVVTVEIRSRSSEDDEWQLMHAFVGWLDRHFSDQIVSINIQYR